MAYGGLNKYVDAAAELGGNPVSKHQILPEYGDECRPISREQILRRERGQGNIYFPCSADSDQDWQPYAVDPYSCYICDRTHTHPLSLVTVPTQTKKHRANLKFH